MAAALARNATLADRRPMRIVAVGKAAPAMVSAFLRESTARSIEGVIIGPAGHPVPEGPLTWMPSSHPVPDARSVAAGRAALSLADRVAEQEVLQVLLSGGASALMAVPAEGVSLEAKQEVTRRLLAADANIHAVNCVRKHLSAIKGGQLARRARGRVVTLAISDVVGDDPSVIGSGPTVADPTTFAEALAVLDRHGGRGAFPPPAVARLEAGARGEIPETPKPHDGSVRQSVCHVIGSCRDAIEGALVEARSAGFSVRVLDDPVVGEARAAACAYAERLADLARAGGPPVCVLSAGETTVAVHGSGRGGRNQEFALAVAPALAGLGRPAVVVSLGTDGVDGPTDAAGAIADSTTTLRAAAHGLDPMRYLENNDAWSFFDALGDLVRTGPTGTNVGDLQVAVIGR